MSLALLFPGQGAQRPGFLHTLPDHPRVMATLDEASDVLHRDARALDTAEALTSTVGVQLSAVIAGVAVARALEAEGTRPQAVAGLSVGSFAAAIVAGAISFADALPLVALRGDLMERAYPEGYGMVAVVGLPQGRIERLIEGMAADGAGTVFLANLNAPLEFVLAGDDASLDAAIARAQAVGARKSERLAVAVPSHCRLLADVAQELQEALSKVAVLAPNLVYVGNRRARVLRDAASVREELGTNVAFPVLWADSTALLAELGTTLFLEAPPGDVLTRLADAAFPDATARAMDATGLKSAGILAARDGSALR